MKTLKNRVLEISRTAKEGGKLATTLYEIVDRVDELESRVAALEKPVRVYPSETFGKRKPHHSDPEQL